MKKVLPLENTKKTKSNIFQIHTSRILLRVFLRLTYEA
ncbi:hypothetical protein SynBIOSE41_00185 [Synechococcus sp. BIOS-E4-1]|nr:hypothetical protein SynBIOSE41_00185 [Synechococcus sp. BIOS-E4-1]